MPGFVGLPEIILFGIVALLIFGPKKLPEMGRSLGKGMREFKDSVSGSDSSPTRIDVLPVVDEAANPFEQTADTDAAPAPAPAATTATPAR